MDAKLKKLVVNGFIWNTLSVFGYRIIGLCIFIILARLLTPEAFGLVAISFVYIAFVNIFLEQGFSEAIIQQEEISNKLLDTAFYTNNGIGIVFVFLSWIFAPFISLLFHEQELTPIIRVLSILFIVNGLISVPVALLRREFKFHSLAYGSLSGVAIGGIIAILMACSGWGVWSIVFYQIASKTIECGVVWMQYPWMPSFQFDVKSLMILIKFGVNVTGSRILTYVNRYGADCIIGIFLGAVYVGYYNVALRLIRTIVDITGSVISKVSFSLFARIQRDTEKGRRYLYQIIRYVSFLSFPIFLLLFILTENIVNVFMGSQWVPAIPLMKVFVLIGVLYSISFVNNAVFLGYGKPQWRLYLDSLNAISNITVILIAVKYGILAVAFSFVLRGYFLYPVPLYALSKILHIRVSDYCYIFYPSLVATALMGAGIVLVQMISANMFNYVLSAGLSLFIWCTVGILLYIIIYMILFRNKLMKMKIELLDALSESSMF